jgi:integrase
VACRSRTVKFMAHVEKRGSGRWRARYRAPNGRERSKTFARRVDAERFLATAEAAKLRGEWVAPERSRVTVGEWAAEWMAGRVHLKPKTVASYESLLRTRILPTWESVPLASITNAEVVAWVAELRSAGLSPSRTRQAYHILTAMLDAAVRDRRLPSNPAAGVDLSRIPQKERRYLDHTQVEALANECGPYRVLVLTLAYSGLRWGEAAALRVRRIDLMRGRLEIAEAVTEVNGRLVFGPPKTHQTRRAPVPAFLRDELMVHLAGRSVDTLAFTAPGGGVLRVSNFRRGWFDAATRAVGLNGLVPHELRHTAASLAIASGASVKGVQSMLGHASATLTLDRYGHLFGDELDAVAERIDAARTRAFSRFSRPDRGLAEVQQLPGIAL